MKKNQSTITIPVKPYIRRYFEINYTDPVDFSHHPFFRDQIHRMIAKPDRRSDRMIPDRMKNYSSYINVLVSEDDILRYGFVITKTDVVRFNTMFEFHIKFMMRSIIGMKIEMGSDIKNAIIDFQDNYHFDENVWPFETIRKDFYRNGAPYRFEFRGSILNRIERKFMENLSQARDKFQLPDFTGFTTTNDIKNEHSDNF